MEEKDRAPQPAPGAAAAQIAPSLQFHGQRAAPEERSTINEFENGRKQDGHQLQTKLLEDADDDHDIDNEERERAPSTYPVLAVSTNPALAAMTSTSVHQTTESIKITIDHDERVEQKGIRPPPPHRSISDGLGLPTRPSEGSLATESAPVLGAVSVVPGIAQVMHTNAWEAHYYDQGLL